MVILGPWLEKPSTMKYETETCEWMLQMLGLNTHPNFIYKVAYTSLVIGSTCPGLENTSKASPYETAGDTSQDVSYFFLWLQG